MDETTAQPGGPAVPPGTPNGAPPRSGADGFFDSVRRMGLVRAEERWVGGVAGGLAVRLGIDPLVVRGLFVIGALLGGLGLVVYGIGWLLLPEQHDGRIHMQQLFRGDFDAAVIGGFAAIVLGLGASDAWGLPWWGAGRRWSGGLVGVLAVVAVVLIVLNLSRNRSTGPTTTLPPTAPYGPQAAPFVAPTTPPAPTAATAPRPAEGTSMPAVPPTSSAPQGGPTPGPTSAPYTTSAYTPPTAHTAPAYTAPTYTAPTYTAPTYTAPSPYAAPKPHDGPQTALPKERSGPGARPVGIVVALSLIVYAALRYAERIGEFDHPVLLTTAAVMVILAGLGVAVAGAFGRTAGGLGALAVVTLVLAGPIAAARNVDWSNAQFVGEATYRPTDPAVAEKGYSVIAGSVILDLTDLDLGDETITVPVSVGAGELTVIVPEDVPYTAQIRQSAGDITWLDEPTISGAGNTGWRTFDSAAVADGAEPQLELELTVFAGELTVEEGR